MVTGCAANMGMLTIQRTAGLAARGVAKGVVHKNTASRKVSRLAARVKSLKA
mgnify:CR=1 FL=1